MEKYTFKIFVNGESKIPKQASIDIANVFKIYTKKHVRITIEKWVNKLSNLQNRYWRGVVVKEFSDKLGYDGDTMHIILKVKCGWYDLVDVNGEEIKVPRSIMKNAEGNPTTTTEMMGIIEEAQRWGSELGIYIPDPDQHYKQYRNEESSTKE